MPMHPAERWGIRMKKWISCIAAALLVVLCTGCRQHQQTAPSTVSRIVSVPSGATKESFPLLSSVEDSGTGSETAVSVPEITQQPSETSSAEEVPDDVPEEEMQLPIGVARASKGKLRFTTSVLSLSLIFPEEFCVLNTDYYPSYGVYLQNKEGTATLLTESVVDKTLTYRQMAAYLREKYPTAKVYTNDTKDVVCKLSMTDEDGHELYVQQKIRVQSGGYNAAVLCCRIEDKDHFEKVFNGIYFK